MRTLCLGMVLLISLGGFGQESKQSQAKDKWKGFNITLNAGLLEGNIDKFAGTSSTRWDNDINWQSQSLSDYGWGKGIENRSGYAIGLNLGYNWVLPHRFLLGAEVGAAKTSLSFYLYGSKITEDIPMRGVNTVVGNADVRMLSNGNLVLGKIFGKRSDYIVYAKGGVTNSLVRFGAQNDYYPNPSPSTGSASTPAVEYYTHNLWNWGYNVGGGIKYAVSSRLSIGLEYLYSKFNDMEQVTGSVNQPIQHEFRTQQRFDMHTVNMNLTLRLGKKSKPIQPVYCPEPTVIVDTVKVIEEKIVYVEKEKFGKPEVGKTIVLRNIYYDFDKSFIREDAKPDLNKVISYMKEYPTIKIELKSHTDSRGSASYNQELSQRRAQAATDYIVNAGISANRIIAKGYGESTPVNNCVDGVTCTEEQHQENRRTEFTIISID